MNLGGGGVNKFIGFTVHDKQIADAQIHIHTIFTIQQEELDISLDNIRSVDLSTCSCLFMGNVIEVRGDCLFC